MSKGNKGGRPKIITEAVVVKLERSLQNGFTIGKACFLSGISEDAFYDKRLIDPEFSGKMDRAGKWAEEKARQNITKAISDGDERTSRWYLERKARAEFATRQELTGKDGQPLNEALDEGKAKTLDDILREHTKKDEPSPNQTPAEPVTDPNPDPASGGEPSQSPA